MAGRCPALSEPHAGVAARCAGRRCKREWNRFHLLRAELLSFPLV